MRLKAQVPAAVKIPRLFTMAEVYTIGVYRHDRISLPGSAEVKTAPVHRRPPSDKSATFFLVINRGSHSLCELSVTSRFRVLHSSLRDAEDERVIASDIGVNVLDDYEDEAACDVRLRIFPLGSPRPTNRR